MNHGAEFENLERPAVLADSPLAVEYRPPGFQPHRHRTEKKNGTHDHQSHHGPDGVKYSLAKKNVKPTPHSAGFSSRAYDIESSFHSILYWDPTQLWNTAHRCSLLFVDRDIPLQVPARLCCAIFEI